MTRVTAYILLGLGAIAIIPSSIYSMRHPRRRGDPLGGPRIAAVVVSTAATVLVVIVIIAR
jgi:hypothetical protein